MPSEICGFIIKYNYRDAYHCIFQITVFPSLFHSASRVPGPAGPEPHRVEYKSTRGQTFLRQFIRVSQPTLPYRPTTGSRRSPETQDPPSPDYFRSLLSACWRRWVERKRKRKRQIETPVALFLLHRPFKICERVMLTWKKEEILIINVPPRPCHSPILSIKNYLEICRR